MTIVPDEIGIQFCYIFLCIWKKLLNLFSLLARVIFMCLITNREFSIKTTYYMLSTRNNTKNNLNPIFEKVWKWKEPVGIRATLWEIIHGRWMTSRWHLAWTAKLFPTMGKLEIKPIDLIKNTNLLWSVYIKSLLNSYFHLQPPLSTLKNITTLTTTMLNYSLQPLPLNNLHCIFHFYLSLN